MVASLRALRSYFQHEESWLSILHPSDVQELPVWLIATLVADLHPFEDGCVENDAMHVLSPHDNSRLLFVLRRFFVGACLEFEAYIHF